MSWETVKLGDICEKIGSGATPKGGATVYIESGVSLIRSQNVYNLNFDYNGLVHINNEAAAKLNSVTVKENDVLLNITGDSVARTCVVPSSMLPARVNQHVAIVRPNKDILDPFFLNYYLASPFMQSYMLGLAVGKGASRNAMTKEMIEKFEVPCPSLPIQKTIVEKLKAYDDLIENNRRQIKLLEEAAQRLYKEWFVDLRFPGWETAPITDGVPEGWSTQTVEELSCVLRRGISPKYNEKAKYMVINQKCIRQAVMDMSEARHQEKAYPDELNLQDGDVVICSTGTGTLGRVGQVYGNYANTTFDSHVTLVRAAIDTGAQFLYQAIKSNQAYLMGCGKGSTNQQELNKDVIKAVKLLVPTDKLLSTFENQAQAIHDKIRNLRDQSSLATEARDRLLPKLMSGELEV